MTGDRSAAVGRLVQVALAITPSAAMARRVLEDWHGHPADPGMRADAIDLLDRLEREAAALVAEDGQIHD